MIDEDVEDALAAVLLDQELAVALRIPLIEIVAAVIDAPGEVRPIRQLKGKNRIHVIATNTLKLAHRPSLLTRLIRQSGHGEHEAGTGVIQQCAVAGAVKRDRGSQGQHEHRGCNAVLPSRHLSRPVAQTERSTNNGREAPGLDVGDEQVDAARLAPTSFPHGTGIVETERPLPDRAETTLRRECRLGDDGTVSGVSRDSVSARQVPPIWLRTVAATDQQAVAGSPPKLGRAAAVVVDVPGGTFRVIKSVPAVDSVAAKGSRRARRSPRAPAGADYCDRPGAWSRPDSSETSDAGTLVGP